MGAPGPPTRRGSQTRGSGGVVRSRVAGVAVARATARAEAVAAELENAYRRWEELEASGDKLRAALQS